MYTYQSICTCQILEKKLDEQKQQAAHDTPCQEVTKPDPPKGREGKGRSHSDSSSSLKQEPVMYHNYKTISHLLKQKLKSHRVSEAPTEPMKEWQKLHSCNIIMGCCLSLCGLSDSKASSQTQLLMK